MEYQEFTRKLKLEGGVIGIDRISRQDCGDRLPEPCLLATLKRVMAGNTVYVNSANMSCKGGCTGVGLSDGIPDIPGGFGHFIASGRGKGYPSGERVKKDPKTAKDMLLNQPQNVMDGNDAIRLSPYEPGDNPELVTILVNPDQLSALVHIFNYENADYDNVIMPMSSGCSSVFRIPFGELGKGSRARAVVGNVDIFSRLHFPADRFFFTIPGSAFRHMLGVADESILASPIWNGIAKRLGVGNE